MRTMHILVLAAAMQLPAAVYAQQVSIGRWVDRVDAAHSTITIRTLAHPRTIQVAPNAVIRVNGVDSRLEQLPANSAISITADKGPTGVLSATQVSVRSNSPQPSAAAPPGSVVSGILVGMNIPENTITLRTPSGDHVYPLDTAPILVNRMRGSSRDLRVGEVIQIQRSLPTEASTDFITRSVQVLSYPSRMTTNGTARAAYGARGTVQSRTRGYQATYNSRRAPLRRRTRHARRRTHARTSRQARRDSAGIQAVAALTGTPPVVVPSSPTADTASVSTAVVAPGTVYVPSGEVSPGVVYVTPGVTGVTAPLTSVAPAVPGGIIGVAPATAPDPRFLSSGANGAAGAAPDARGQAGALNGASAAGVGDPRIQSIGPNAAIGAGAAPAAGVPDPRFQSLGPGVVPGAAGPNGTIGVPTPAPFGGFGRPGFIGPRAVGPPFPRVIIPRPMIAPAAPVAPR